MILTPQMWIANDKGVPRDLGLCCRHLTTGQQPLNISLCSCQGREGGHGHQVPGGGGVSWLNSVDVTQQGGLADPASPPDSTLPSPPACVAASPVPRKAELHIPQSPGSQGEDGSDHYQDGKACMPKIDEWRGSPAGEPGAPFLNGTIFPFVLSNATQLHKATKARRRRQRGLPGALASGLPARADKAAPDINTRK